MDEIKKEIIDSHYRNHISISDSENLHFTVKVGTKYSEEYNLFRETLNAVNFIHDLDIKDYKIIIEDSFDIYGKDIFEINFNNCTFKKEIRLISCNFLDNVSFMNCEFKECLDLNNSKFKENIRFHDTIFHQSSFFENTTFHKLVDFYRAKFIENQQFHLTDFLDRAIFSNVIFKKQIQFLYNRVKSSTIISFENAEFISALDISRSNFKCQLHFWNTKVNDNPKEYWLYSSDSITKEELNINEALKRMRESFRIIKNELKVSGNIINSLGFHKSEMQIYHRELKEFKGSNWSDRIILKFSEISNNYGTKWQKGLTFTLLSGLIFYVLFLILISDNLQFELSKESIGKTLKHYFEFLNVTNWNFKPFGISDFNYAYVILFIGKIFIGYGYFQTIQAFRKYGKN
ncbi:pentapeptide repeat-containing protein [Tenacibaculum piscium]|uniref:pentapeptide repeat-containing protein n=1 Tax=Tenacibaculum piscium TaxID=1458515 RepID=UPI001F2179A7|nr:pentapeptide repeat-containing protein [Tenacibaculum piscium]